LWVDKSSYQSNKQPLQVGFTEKQGRKNLKHVDNNLLQGCFGKKMGHQKPLQVEKVSNQGQ